MANANLESSHNLPKGGVINSFLDGATVAAIRRRLRAAATRRAVADLTTDELNDIGYPVADSPHNRPTLEVKAGLMTTLMSMR